MSTKHLTAGSTKPALIKGQARLYSMKFCPFAHRIRLILTLKKIPHDIVNIHLKNKPEWYTEIHPEGKVPAFVDIDGQVIVDSTVIAKYLDDKYPIPRLTNEVYEEQDKELLDKYSKITGIFSNCIHGKDNRKLDEIVTEISIHLKDFEDELTIRGSVFYGGTEPGMLDILMWPWVERAKSLPIIYNEPLNFNKEQFPHIITWITNMRALPFVEKNSGSYEKFAQHIKSLHDGNINFDL